MQSYLPFDFEPTDQQRPAIEHVHGPMLVVAGAGTGKTTVLARRIAYLIESEAARPKEILAVTYTRNAAAQLIARVSEILYPHLDQQSAARKLMSSGLRPHTFHSYCYGLLLDANIQFALLDEKDLQILLRRRIQDLPLKRFIRAADPGQFLKDLLEFFRSCHDELRTPDDYEAYVKRLERGEIEPPRVGKSKDAETMAREEVLERCNEIARVFHYVEDLLKQEGLGTFGHIITRAVELLGRQSIGIATRAKTCAIHSDRRVPGLQRRPDPARPAACRGRGQCICGGRSRPGNLSFSWRDQRSVRSVSEDFRPGAGEARDSFPESAVHAAYFALRPSDDRG